MSIDHVKNLNDLASDLDGEGYPGEGAKARAAAAELTRVKGHRDALMKAAWLAKNHLVPVLDEPGSTVFWKLDAAIKFCGNSVEPKSAESSTHEQLIELRSAVRFATLETQAIQPVEKDRKRMNWLFQFLYRAYSKYDLDGTQARNAAATTGSRRRIPRRHECA